MHFLKKYRHIITLIVICLAAVFFTLTDGGIHIRDLWYDEAYSLFIIKASWMKLWWFIYQDVHQPTYYWIIKLWSYLVGNSDVAIRSFSLLPYVGVIVFSYLLTHKITKNKYISLLAAAAIAANPFIREYAQEARMYELLACIWMFIFYKSVSFIEGEKTKAVGWAIGVGLMGGLFVHYFSLIYGVGYLILFFAIVILQKRKNHAGISLWRTIRSTLVHCWMIYVPLIIGFLISLPLMLHQYASGYVGSVLQPMTWKFVIRSIGVFFLGHEQGALGIQPVNQLFSFHGSSIAGICFAIAGVLVVLYSLYHRRRRAALLVTLAGRGALFAVIILSALKGNNMYVERYFIFLSPLLIISLALCAYHPRKKLGYIVALLFIILSFGINQPTYVRNGLRDYMKTAIALQVPAVAIHSDLDYLVARYYLEYYQYTGKIILRTNDPRTPHRSIYEGTTSFMLQRNELTGTTALISYQKQDGAELLPYHFGFAHMYLYTPSHKK